MDKLCNSLLVFALPQSYRDCVIQSYLEHCEQNKIDYDFGTALQYSLGGISYRIEKLYFVIAASILKLKSSLKW